MAVAAQPAQSPAVAPTPPSAAAGEAVARKVCASCHAFPPPDILPRDKWSAKVFEMAGFAMAGTGVAPGSKDLPLDLPLEQIVAYYESKAPRELPPPEAWPEPSDAPVRFARHPMGLPGGLLPAVANVRLFTMTPERGLEVIAADMSNGLVMRGSPSRPDAGLEVIARVPNPCHTAAVDLDK